MVKVLFPGFGVEEEFVAPLHKAIFMKRTIFLIGMLIWINAVAQDTSKSDEAVSTTKTETSQGDLGPSDLTFTNQSGGTFSVADLESQLRNLQTSAEQTLDMLTAYNSTLTSGSAAEALGGVLSKVLKGNRDKTGTETDTEQHARDGSSTSSVTSNLVGVLRGLLNTNQTASIPAATIDQLKSLQKDLTVIVPKLQTLNGGDDTTVTSGSSTNNSVLTPTGRESTKDHEHQ